MRDQSTAPVSTSLSVLKEGNVSVEDFVFLLLLFFSVAAFLVRASRPASSFLMGIPVLRQGLHLSYRV